MRLSIELLLFLVQSCCFIKQLWKKQKQTAEGTKHVRQHLMERNGKFRVGIPIEVLSDVLRFSSGLFFTQDSNIGSFLYFHLSHPSMLSNLVKHSHVFFFRYCNLKYFIIAM